MDITESTNITPANSGEDTSNVVDIQDGYGRFVRYAETDENGAPDQLHRLHSLRDPVPTDADFVSPVYLLTDKQAERHDELLNEDNLFRVRDHTSIATKIQTECEDDGRVYYPVFVESDADVEYYKMRAGLKRFVRDVLEVDPIEAMWFFSGGSSLHVHLPYYTNGDAIERIRRETKQYNEAADVTVDASNFTKKSLTRLPGAEHHDTGIKKTSVSPTSSNENLQKRIAKLVAGVALKEKRGVSHNSELLETVRHSLSDELKIINEVPTPLVEKQEKPTGTGYVERWKQYNRHPFCPYANTGNQRRSVVIAQMKGTPFCRKTTVNGIEKWRTYIPTFIYGAVGADGEYTVWRENAPIQLSKQDYEKWEFEPGDTIILLGGNSTSSRIIELEDTFGKEISAQLLSEMNWTDDSTDGRRMVLNVLRVFGYKVGSAGKNGPRRDTSTNDRGSQSTEAYRLQQRAEEDHVESLGHDERLDVANRLLHVRGWDGADEWFQEQYGEQYSEQLTHKFLRSVVKKYDDVPSTQ
jgi:hypothetical protein